MARIHGVAGEWARVKGTALGLWPVFLGLFILGFAVATLVFASAVWGLATCAVALGWMGFSVLKGLRHIERYFKGARGEERVAGILRGLPDDYHVFNDFVAGREHVDHVVIGPAGVFAVETKCWRGAVTVEDGHVLLDGQLPSREPLAQAHHEAQSVRTALKALGWDGGVTPVLAFASDNFAAHVAEVQGAVVINSCDLRCSFDTKRVVIPPAELSRLIGLLG